MECRRRKVAEAVDARVAAVGDSGAVVVAGMAATVDPLEAVAVAGMPAAAAMGRRTAPVTGR